MLYRLSAVIQILARTIVWLMILTTVDGDSDSGGKATETFAVYYLGTLYFLRIYFKWDLYRM